ncbi:MAG: hypothetical protein P1U56_08665 [Saprospiraceae bacterium]|nr:hypothetical protein [Saprospiraceae bacterium]
MFKIKQSNFLFNSILLFALIVGFYSCEQEQFQNPEIETVETSYFQQHLEDNTQHIIAQDQGEGSYRVVGNQGTTISIEDALVDASGERVRGEVEVELIEIYSVADMILNRKQTLADYDGIPAILESGGEVFVKVYQDGQELFADGKGDMRIFLPTENTGGARENMELYYGDEVGDQVIWKPTGEKIKVVNSESREGEDYLVIIQNTLGWINVDIIYAGGGEEVECLEVIIQCPEICEGGAANTVVAVHLSSLNSAFELTYDPVSGSYKLCGGQEGAITVGGLQASFIVAITCPNGMTYVAIVTTTINPGYHTEIIYCPQLTPMGPGEFADALNGLL